jgi:hypothetical protein
VNGAEHRIIAPLPSAAPSPEPLSMPPPTFIPLALSAPTVDGEIRIELQARWHSQRRRFCQA